MTTNAIRIGGVMLTRVGYADVGIDPARVGLTAEQIEAVTWAEPLWADGKEVRAGAAVWVIQDGDARIAVDPAQAADDIIRRGPRGGGHAAGELHPRDLHTCRGDWNVGVAQ